MKGIERFELVDKVARELQARMTFDDIGRYLKNMGVSASPGGSWNSKWAYAKDFLASASEQTVIRIADELGIAHNFTVAAAGLVTESKFWEPSHFRLFLSHLASLKVQTGKLKLSLRKYAISAFVAHEDIEPTKEWQDEIESALFSMDALAALITPHFVESKWADQEMGIAIGRNILVIPVMREATPHGFIGKYQAVNANGKSVAEVARAIFDTLLTSNQTRSRLLACMVDATVLEPSPLAAVARLGVIESVADLPQPSLERLRDGAARSAVFQQSSALSERLEHLLRSKGVTLAPAEMSEPEPDDQVPF